MARRKPVWLQKREYTIAQAREAYYTNKTPTTTTTVRKRATDSFAYGSYSLRSATASNIFKVGVTKLSLAFFGGNTALGLKTLESITDPVSSKPRNFTPAMVHAMKAGGTPTAHVTPWGSRVIKYSVPTTGEAQAFYSAPICSSDPVNTFDKADTKATAVFNAVKGNLGDADYSRFYLTPEKLTVAKN